jgi:hypothetical protein
MTSPSLDEGFQIAVLLPCYNVGATIGAAVRGFATALPGARIYVFDNNSTDDTAREAAHAGALVFREARQGKGAVVRRMFADIEADIYVMASGDGGCDPADAPSLVNALITEHVDMVVGTLPRTAEDSRRPRRWFGRVGDVGLADTASGYRAFSRRFVKSFPAVSGRLGIEAETSLHAQQLMIPIAEIELAGRQRGKGADFSMSLTHLGGMARLLRESIPLAFYGIVATVMAAVGALLFMLGISSGGGAVSPANLPAVIFGTGLLIVAALIFALGVIVENIQRSRIEHKRMLFLSVHALGAQ